MCTICSSYEVTLKKYQGGDDPIGDVVPQPYAQSMKLRLSPSASEDNDLPNSTATTALIGQGEIFEGEINKSGDSDWIQIELEAFEAYTFLTWGTGGQPNALPDTELRLRDADGEILAENDDLSGTDSLTIQSSGINYTPETSGIYYLDVSGFGDNAGLYRLMASSSVATPEVMAIYMTEIGWNYPTAIGFAPDVTELSYNILGLDDNIQVIAREAFNTWEIYTGITFNESTGDANIFFDDAEEGAFAGPDDVDLEAGTFTTATGNVGPDFIEGEDQTFDSELYLTFLHEIGHALGINHTGPYDGNATYGEDEIFLNDSTQLSIMSYFNQEDNSNIESEYAVNLTPMIADILAIEHLYGTFDAHDGDTTWGANSNIDGALGAAFGILYDGEDGNDEFWTGNPVTYTILDTDGVDVIDLSTSNEFQKIDLTPGSVSDVGGISGGLTIAVGSIIENAIGGQGIDLIVGNDAANHLIGNSGDDVFVGGQGDDILNGGADWDVASFSGSQNNYTIVLSPNDQKIIDRRENADGVDTLIDMELLYFGEGDALTNLDFSQLDGIASLSPEDFGSFIELYIAYFNRAPDAVGLNFWGTAFANGTTLKDMATLFIDQPETRETYPEATSNTEFTTAVYNNVLGRTPDQGGIDFWVGALDSGEVQRDQFILEVLKGAKSALKPDEGEEFVNQQLADRAYLENKVDLGAYFAVHRGLSNVENASSVMALFDGSKDSIDQAVSAIDAHYQQALDPEQGEFLMQVVGVLENPFIA